MEPTNPQANQSPTAASPEPQRPIQPPQKKNSLMAWVIAVLLIAAVITGLYLLYNMRSTPSSVASGPAQVMIKPDGFSPATIKVKKGQAVVWTNQDGKQHSIQADQDGTDLDGSETLEDGDTFSYSFTDAGTYSYHDPLNNSSFKGVIIVE